MINTYSRMTYLVGIIILCLPLTVFANAGKAIFVIGKAHLINTDGEKIRIKRGGEIHSGDVIVTSRKSQVQLKMKDGTLVAVRPDSEFKIDNYQYDQDIATDKSIYKLVKGGFRSITGKMGKAKKSSYAVKTVVGTIGIRGTDFSARICENNCGEEDNGLYVGVMQGGVVLSNDSGTIDVFPGDFGFMQDPGVAPEYLETMPGNLLFAQTNQNSADKKTAIVKAESTDTQLSSTISNETTSTIEKDNNIVLAINTENNSSLLSGTTPVEQTQETIDSMSTEEIAAIADPVVDPIITGIIFPSEGIATYNTITDHNINLGTLNQSTTQLSVNFANSEVTASFVVDDLNSESWSGSNSETITYDADGNFSGNLSGSADSIFGNRGLTGNTNGSLLDATPSVEDAPATATATFTLTDDATTLNGNVDFSLTSVQ